MDKLGTYALFAALREITQRGAVSGERGVADRHGITGNERWISLRSNAHMLEQTSIEPLGVSSEKTREEPSIFRGFTEGNTRKPTAENMSAHETMREDVQREKQPVLTTSPQRRSFDIYRNIEMRHQAARASRGRETPV